MLPFDWTCECGSDCPCCCKCPDEVFLPLLKARADKVEALIEEEMSNAD